LRTISDKQGLTLKAATRRSVGMAGGGEAFSTVTRIKAGNLSKYGSPNEDHAETFMPIDVAVECDIEAGSPIILSAMAEMQGYKLVPVDGVELPASSPLSAVDALAIANEAGDVVRAITQAIADGRVCGADEKEITREIDEAMRAMKAALDKVRAR
jgi:hypothetical protein